VLPTLDRTFETLVASIDQTLRHFGGTPTYGLTENVPRHIFGVLLPGGLCGRAFSGSNAMLVSGLVPALRAT